MKKALITAAGLMLFGTLAQATPAEDVIADLTAKGFSDITLEVGRTKIEARATNGTDIIEAIYDANGVFVRSETDPSESGDGAGHRSSGAQDDDDGEHQSSGDHEEGEDHDEDDHDEDDHDDGDRDGGHDDDHGGDHESDDHDGGDDDS